MIDYHLQNPTRRCATSGRELAPGEAYYSAVVEGNESLQRRDYAVDQWRADGDDYIGWWRSQMPAAGEQRVVETPVDVLLEVFDRWSDDTAHADRAYLLALLLVRRKVFRLDDDTADSSSAPNQGLRVVCPRRAATYTVPVANPDHARQAELQRELQHLLYGDAA